ncbi:INO80 complex subunit C [Acipenser oxyrinchus oxyrinchus]|uniref:INO80 complex subunit C n=1 Tax=Acipenser oxyrinchus oxyrinchus TaxID=40147 RepID=A0AAD8LQU4_ACIOX|nr:INO80 complex subunit C [Acipenser oxyrinchus oxyrinchus]
MDEICSTGQVSLSAMLVTTDLVTPASPNSNIKPPASQASQARGKKRPASPANNNVGAAAAFFNKKKKLTFTTAGTELQQLPLTVDPSGEIKTMAADPSTAPVEPTAKPQSFKDPNFVHSGIGGAAAGKKNRTWKNLKQILTAERALPWQLNDPNYYNIDAPPSFKPTKKYSDISGLPANYTDPQSKLRFSTAEEFSYIRMLPADVVTGYLTLRKATCIVP